MKLRHIFTALAAVLTLTFVGCQEEERFLDEVKVSQSYIAIPAEGGKVEVTVNAIDKWEIAGVPEWLTVTPASGVAGETKVTFSAGAATATAEAVLHLNCGEVSQILTVLQMTEKVDLPITSCKFVNEEGVDGTIYRVKGQVTSIANTEYGNFYIDDGTGVAYVYGTLYDGAEKQFSKHGIAVGDVVTVEGPRKDYNGTIELVNVTVVEIVKSLLVVDPMDVELEKEAGEFTVGVSNKGFCTVEVDVDWIKFTGLGTDKAMFTYEAYEQNAAPRKGTITFTVVKGDRESVVPVSVTQYGITPDPIAIAEAAKAEKGTWLSVKGIVTGVCKDGVIVTDEAGSSLYGYKATGLKIGDEVLMTGKFSNYRQFYQIDQVPVVRVLSKGNKVAYPKAVAITSDVLSKYAGAVSTAQYIEATGVSDGANYGAVTVAGHTISPYQSTIDMSKYAGKNVTIKGYTLQYQSSKSDLRICVTSVEEVK